MICCANGIERADNYLWSPSNLCHNRTSMKLVPEVTQCDVIGPAAVRLSFRDGWKGVLDLKPILHGRMFGTLKSPAKFREARVQDGSLVWPNGADICPSVLRYWCELGRVCSQEELDAHFAGSVTIAASVVAETTAKYPSRRKR